MSTIDEIVYYCHQENTFGALMLTGAWGSGKTYFVENELKEKLGKDFIVIRISLFGEDSVEKIVNKVQKNYFQALLENIGEDSKKIGGKTWRRTYKEAKKLSEYIDESALGTVARFIKKVAEKNPGIEKVFSFNLSECVPIEKTIAERTVIFVFDDLERCTVDEVNILGCINEYCENKQIKTIIVTNEEKMLREKSSKNQQQYEEKNIPKDEIIESKIKYKEIKEKLVTKTIKYIPNCEEIVEKIVIDYKCENAAYKEFLERSKSELKEILRIDDIKNFRSVKCGIQDFKRVYDLLEQMAPDDILDKILPLSFQAFIIFTLWTKAGKICKSEKYGYLVEDTKIEKKYFGYYDKSYMPTGLKKWIVEGIWDEKCLKQEIEALLQKQRQRKIDPIECVRYSDLLEIDEEILNQGISGLLEMAYNGELDLNDYVRLLGNLNTARTISYSFPEVIDMEKLKLGVEKCFKRLCAKEEKEANIHMIFSQEYLKGLTPNEMYIYNKIQNFREHDIQTMETNKRNYLKILKTCNFGELYEFERTKAVRQFDREVAEAVSECYKMLANSKRRIFVEEFYEMWKIKNETVDFQYEESLEGMEYLLNELSEILKDEERKKYRIKQALTKEFISKVKELIGRYQCKMKKQN